MRNLVSQLGYLAVLSASLCNVGWAGDHISAAEAAGKIGKRETVCGRVANAKYAATAHGQPTFLDFDRAYPAMVFTAVIWGSDRKRFNEPPESLQGRDACVTGTIELYKGEPQIIVRDPSQLSIVGEAKDKKN